jgi:DNA-directed RNA polymerase specialized sigma24 family protein
LSAGIKLPPLPVEDESNLTSLQLLERCLSGKATNVDWRMLVSYINKKCRGVVFRLLSSAHIGTPDHIDEVLGQILYKLVADDCRRLRNTSFSHENAFVGFLAKTALHKSIDYLSLQRHKEVPLPENDPPAQEPPPERGLLIGEIRRYLEERATKSECDIFWHHYYLGCSAREISEREGPHRSVKDVEYVLWKLMQILRKRFGASGGPPSGGDI